MNCSITIVSVGNNQVHVSRVLREVFDYDLQQAKRIVDFTPYTFPKEYPMEFAKDLEYKLTQAGATVKLEGNDYAYTPSTNSEQTSIKKLTKKEELIDYFKTIFELESQIYTYKRIEQTYADKLKVMGIPQTLYYRMNEDGIPLIYNKTFIETLKPEWLETKEYKEIYNLNPKEHKLRNKIARSIYITILIAILAAMIIFTVIRSGGILGLFWIAIPIALVICFGVMGYYWIDERFPVDKSEFNDKETRMRNYFQERTKNEERMRIENENRLKPLIENECNELVIKPKEDVKKLLNKLYSQNIIFPKYRTYAAVAQIYEYLASGRCDQLEGPNGAYNLYESELRQNIIIDRLDEVINQLERLNRTMSAICGAIYSTNHLLSNINSTLGHIEANTALMTYHTQCIAYNTNVANRYKEYI